MRPLDFLGRIKVKLGLVILLAVATAFAVNEYGLYLDLSGPVRMAVAGLLSLVIMQVLARGMTRPLREMAAAAQIIAKGHYGLRVSASSRDEVGELARAFNAMAADLGEVDRQRRELVANVSHELRTPITGLQAVLENVVDGVSPPDRETLGTALAQTERLGRLVGQLLDLSRLESGARRIDPETVEVAELCGQAIREAALARDDVTLECDVEPGLAVTADPALLAQVLANLLDNAVRHSPPGAKVVVSGTACGASGLRLSVADQGPGIPVADRTRVFERFSRLDEGRAADAGGSGLGLAIVKEIVELHGGTIAVADAPVGCRMVVELPGRVTGSALPERMIMNDSPSPGDLSMGRLSGGGPSEEGTAEPVPAGDGRRAPRSAGRAGGGDGLARHRPGTGSAQAARRDGHGDAVRAHAEPAAPDTERAGRDGGGTAGTAADRATSGRTPADLDRPAAGRAVAGADRATAEQVPAGADRVAPGRTWAHPDRPVPERAPVGTDRPAAGSASAGADRTASERMPVGADRTVSGRVPVRAERPASESGPVGADRPVSEQPVAAPPYRAAPRVLSAGRVLLGLVLGGIAGFALGVVAAFLLSFILGDAVGLSMILLLTVLGAMVGLAVGAAGGPQVEPVPGGPDGLVYVPPTILPRPELPEAPRLLLPGTLLTGLLAVAALPGGGTGLGLVLVALVIGAVAFPALRGRGTGWTAAYGLVGYALIGVAVIRDADWVVVPSVLAGCALVTLALSGAGRTWLGVIRGMLAGLLAVPRVPWFLAGPLRRLMPRRKVGPLLAAIGLTAVLLFLFGMLFVSADAVFSTLVRDLLRASAKAENLLYRIFILAVAGALAAAAVLVARSPVRDPEMPQVRLGGGRMVWALPLTALNLLFAAFITVQLTVLFGGDERVIRTAGLTYAQYARSGFFELLTVSVFVLLIVAAVTGAVTPRGADRWWQAVLLGLLCVLTLVILASALHRMDLYTDAYGLSRLRAAVRAVMWWLAAVFGLLLVAGALRLAGRATRWVPRTLVLLSGASLLAFGLWNPELRVAQTHVQARGVARLDVAYLAELGADAVPALDRLPEPMRGCVLNQVFARNELNPGSWKVLDRPWSAWDLSRQRAEELARRHPFDHVLDCRPPS